MTAKKVPAAAATNPAAEPPDITAPEPSAPAPFPVPAFATPPDPKPPKPKPIQWAAGLVAALKKSGTGDGTLNVIRGAMVARANDPVHGKLPPTHPDRHLTAREACAILEIELPGHTFTHAKARQLMETGSFVKPPPTVAAVDLLPPPPEGEAPERALPIATEQPEVRQVAGVLDKIPGVHNVNAEADTVGPKPVRGKVKVGG